MCEMAGIVDDEEIARIIAESDSDWASESDDSFETSLESDSSVPDKKPKVTVHRDSASASDESESDTASGDWKEITDGDDTKTHNLKYSELQGPKHAPPQGASPLSYFYMFFTVQLLQEIVVQTNNYARQFHLNHMVLSPHSRARKWKDLTLAELKGFIACILNMGLERRPTIASYWYTTASQYCPWFHDMFPRDRFQLILKFFHMVDNKNLAASGEQGYDPCAKFQPLVDHANTVFRHYYTPHQQLSVDESLVGTKNHTQLLQYLPNKHHHRWGIKLWMLCDAVTNYCLAFFVYQGAKRTEDKDAIQKYGLAHTVVMKLLKMGNYICKGYHVFMDNFFMSVPLAEDLYKLSTYVTGTIRRNRKFLPQAFQNKFEVGEKKYFRKGPILAAAFREKKSQRLPVLLLSTHSKAEDTQSVRVRHGKQKHVIKPSIVQSYNDFMGGVDASDAMLYSYLDERRTVKYWKKIAFNIFSRMILNSYIIYKQNLSAGCNAMSRLDYTIKIVDALSKEWLEEKNSEVGILGTNNVENDTKLIRKLPAKKEKDCCVCSKRTKNGPVKRRRSRTVCVKCEKGLHGECFPQHKCSK